MFSVKLVIAEIELLARLEAERVLHEPLPAGVAEIESHRSRAVVVETVVVGRSLVDALEQLLHLLEMIRFGAVAATVVGVAGSDVFHRRKDLDFHDMPNVGVEVDGPFADIARIMEHRFLP